MVNKLCISPLLLLVLASMILVLPLKWILAMITAALVHELCHWTAIRLLGGSVHGIGFGHQGAKIFMDGMSSGKVALCALAGPVGSFLLILLGRYCPRLAFCGAVQGLYNLLPIPSMDGWRILQAILPEYWIVFLTKVFNKVVPILFLFLGIYSTFIQKTGIFPLFLGIFLCFRIRQPAFPLLTKNGQRSRMSLPSIRPGE